MNWILAIVLAITATKEYVDRQDGALEAEIATNTYAIAENRIQIATNTYAIAENCIQIATNAVDIAALEVGKQDVISDLETIRSGAALGATALQEHQSLTNYFTKGESDGRYLQSYTETDPTIYDWAKAATRPSYTLNDVCPDTENWLGVPGTTAGGKSIKVLAKTVNGVIEGGMTVTGSSNNDNNTTRYRYGGVSVRRNGTNTDYLWDTTSASGIVRRAELAPFITSETDPTIYSWAKASTKPVYAYSEISNTPDLGVYATTGQVAQALSGKLGNTGDQTLNGTLNVQNDYLPDGAERLRAGDFGFDSDAKIYVHRGNEVYYISVRNITGVLALLSDIASATNALDTAISGRGYLTQHQSLTNYYTKAEVDTAIAGAGGGGVTAVSVASGGTFGTGDLADGKVEMWRVSCAGAYTPSSAWHLIGYSAWPAAGSTWQCTVWRIGSAYYCNIIVVE